MLRVLRLIVLEMSWAGCKEGKNRVKGLGAYYCTAYLHNCLSECVWANTINWTWCRVCAVKSDGVFTGAILS